MSNQDCITDGHGLSRVPGAKRKHFAMMPNVINHLGLTCQTKSMLCVILEYTGPDGQSWVGTPKLAELAAIGRNSVKRCKEELEEKGLCRFIPRVGDKGDHLSDLCILQERFWEINDEFYQQSHGDPSPHTVQPLPPQEDSINTYSNTKIKNTSTNFAEPPFVETLSIDPNNLHPFQEVLTVEQWQDFMPHNLTPWIEAFGGATGVYPTRKRIGEFVSGFSGIMLRGGTIKAMKRAIAKMKKDQMRIERPQSVMRGTISEAARDRIGPIRPDGWHPGEVR